MDAQVDPNAVNSAAGSSAAGSSAAGSSAAGTLEAGNLEAGFQRWQRRFDEAPKRDADFTTLSGLEVDPVYGPPPGSVVPGMERIGWPGEFPYTRGIHATG